MPKGVYPRSGANNGVNIQCSITSISQTVAKAKPKPTNWNCTRVTAVSKQKSHLYQITSPSTPHSWSQPAFTAHCSNYAFSRANFLEIVPARSVREAMKPPPKPQPTPKPRKPQQPKVVTQQKQQQIDINVTMRIKSNSKSTTRK